MDATRSQHTTVDRAANRALATSRLSANPGRTRAEPLRRRLTVGCWRECWRVGVFLTFLGRPLLLEFGLVGRFVAVLIADDPFGEHAAAVPELIAGVKR